MVLWRAYSVQISGLSGYTFSVCVYRKKALSSITTGFLPSHVVKVGDGIIVACNFFNSSSVSSDRSAWGRPIEAKIIKNKGESNEKYSEVWNLFVWARVDIIRGGNRQCSIQQGRS